jgi:uncharacterized membrane protein YtjA (UPF0391 family)
LFRAITRCRADLNEMDAGTSAVAKRLVCQAGPPATFQEDEAMLGWVLTFLVVALIAGVLGFGGIAGASIEIAKVIFFIAVVLFLISVVIGAFRGRSPL